MICLKILGLVALFALVARAANPIFPGADPHAAVIDGKVWIYPTHNENGRNFWAFRMTPQKTWLISEWQSDLGPWARCLAVKGTRRYFQDSVGLQSEGHPSRIGVAVVMTD